MSGIEHEAVERALRRGVMLEQVLNYDRYDLDLGVGGPGGWDFRVALARRLPGQVHCLHPTNQRRAAKMHVADLG